MSMASTLYFNGTQLRYPYSDNVLPNVPKYPSSQEMFRREVPDKYTSKVSRESYQHWTDKWYDFGYPVNRREELPKLADRREPCSQHWMYNPGTSAVDKWSAANKDWPYSTEKFMWRGNPVNEAVRARGINRTTLSKDPNFPPFTSHMTTTYRKPVYSVFGPLQRDKVYGVTHQHNRHGHMPFEDYY
ncbi:hypothetical protein ScPMuIL_006139 [Solemya velum]